MAARARGGVAAPAAHGRPGGRRRLLHLPGRDAPVGFGDGWVLLVDFSKPGEAWSVLAYGQTRQEAVERAQALSLRVLADRLEHGEGVPDLASVFAVVP